MKKHSRVIFSMAAGLTVFIAQLAAFGADTNSTWDLSNINLLSVGKIKAADTNSGTAVFLSDGTFSVTVGGNTFDGTYTNTTKQLTATLSTDGQAALESNVLEFAQANAPEGITVAITGLKIAKIKLSKDGVPVLATTTVKATASETIKGKVKTKNFTVKSLLADWTLTSDTNAFLAAAK